MVGGPVNITSGYRTQAHNQRVGCSPNSQHMHTGMRVSEVCGLTSHCVNLEKMSIKVDKIIIKKKREWVFVTPKTRSYNREILIGITLVNILKRHRKAQMETNWPMVGIVLIVTLYVLRKMENWFLQTL
nr:D-Ala-D-Ala carboxypeptidase family metallohydrolase [Serpentinicella alkaliphila]